jgi:hypothetical protein
MKIKQLAPDSLPSFCWDRNLTCGQIKDLLQNGSSFERTATLEWILRDAPLDELWNFCSPKQVYNQFISLENHLGRRKDFLEYILRTWHELGKF